MTTRMLRAADSDVELDAGGAQEADDVQHARPRLRRVQAQRPDRRVRFEPVRAVHAVVDERHQQRMSQHRQPIAQPRALAHLRDRRPRVDEEPDGFAGREIARAAAGIDHQKAIRHYLHRGVRRAQCKMLTVVCRSRGKTGACAFGVRTAQKLRINFSWHAAFSHRRRITRPCARRDPRWPSRRTRRSTSTRSTRELRRRQGGYGRGRRMAIESDRADILSGVRAGETLGGPVAMLIENRDWPNWQYTMRVDGDSAAGRGRRRGARRSRGRVRATPTLPASRSTGATISATSSSAPAPAKRRRASRPARSRGSCCATPACAIASHVFRIGSVAMPITAASIV